MTLTGILIVKNSIFTLVSIQGDFTGAGDPGTPHANISTERGVDALGPLQGQLEAVGGQGLASCALEGVHSFCH